MAVRFSVRPPPRRPDRDGFPGDCRARCVERGADRVLLVPFFLSPGRHASLHLAEHRDRLAESFPDVVWELKPPLGRHDALVDVILDRIAGPAADPAAS